MNRARRAPASFAQRHSDGTFVDMQQPKFNSESKRPARARVIAAAVAVASLSGAGAATFALAPADLANPTPRTANIHLVTTDVPPPPATNPPPAAETPSTVSPPPPSPAATPAPTSAAAPTSGATPTPAAPGDPARVNNDKGGFSFIVPAGWAQGDAHRLTYGSALLNNPAAPNGSILLGRLDLKLFAGAEPDNAKSAIRLASDMGEFFMPYPGNRINQENQTFDVAGMPAASSYYEVKFDDAAKETGQIWAAAVGKGKDRWFVVWLGTASSPVDKGVAKALTESIRPWTPPAPATPAPTDTPAPGDPNTPPADPNAPPPPAEPPAPAAPAAPAAAPAPAPAPPPGTSI